MLPSEYLQHAMELYDIHINNNLSPYKWLTNRELEGYQYGPKLIQQIKVKGGKMSELKSVYLEYLDSRIKPKSCNTPQQWTCKFDYWLQDEYEFTNEEIDELRSNRNGQGGCSTTEKVTHR